MNWVKKHKLLAIEAIQYNKCLYIKLNNLWLACYISFNLAQSQQISIDILHEVENKPVTKWSPFLEEEFTSAITKYNNLSTPEPDKLL